MFKNIPKKPIIIAILASICFTIILFVFDVFNIPTKLGFNIKVVNNDVWSVVLENIVVITLFIVTFLLFDKRNIEKDNLGKFAGAVTLLNTYKQLSTLLIPLKALIESDNIDEPQSEEIFSQGQIDYLSHKPLEYDEKIFKLLQNGYIKKDQYEKYDTIIKKYKIVVLFLTETKIKKEYISKHFDSLNDDLEKEIKAIESYKESL